MMKEGKPENGLLGSRALIVQKSHQINTEGHLQPFFFWAFQNGLSYENSENTKAPIRHYAHPFFIFSLKITECASFLPEYKSCLDTWKDGNLWSVSCKVYISTCLQETYFCAHIILFPTKSFSKICKLQKHTTSHRAAAADTLVKNH